MALVLPRRGSSAPADTSSAWRAALDQFLRELSPDEHTCFRNASTRPDRPEALVNQAMLSEVEFSVGHPVQIALKKLHNTIQALDQFKAVVDVFVEVYPAGLAPIWGCIRVVMQTAQQYQEYFDKLAEMFEKLTQVLPRLREYERMYDNRRLFLALQAAYLSIIEFCVETMATFRKAKRKGPFSRLRMPSLWKSINGTFREKLKKIDDSLEQVKEEAQTSHMMELSEMRTGQARKDWERLIQFLVQGGKHNQMQATMKQVRHPGTCEWLTTQKSFLEWKSSPESQGMWLHGPVGSGKTITCSYAVEHVKESAEEMKASCAYYYCDYLDGKTLFAASILESIIGQLLECGIPRQMQDFVATQYKCGRFPDFHLSPSEAVDILLEMLPELAKQGPIFVFVDGLDECEEVERRLILTNIQRLLSETENICLKVFISSRDVTDISRSLSTWPTATLSVGNVEHDIRAYVEDQVQQHFESEGIDDDDLQRSADLAKRIIPKLVECADGMFLLVSMQLGLILAAATEYEIEAVLDDLPKGIVETYTRILQHIAKKSRTVEARERVRRTFQWVFAAKRPLTANEITEAVSFSPQDESWDERKIPLTPSRVIDDCRNLVILQGGCRATVRFTHSTVQEFLMGPPENKEVACFHFDPDQANLLAAEMTVSYLSFSDFETSLVYKGRKLSLTDKPVPQRAFLDAAVGREPRSRFTPKVVKSAMTFGRGDVRQGLDFDASRRTMEAVMGRRKSSGTEKYRFLNYAAANWLHHCAMFTPDDEAWQKFENLVLNKSLEFDFRPWEGKWTPRGHPDLACFDWALINGNLAVLALLAATRQSPLFPHTVLKNCLDYEFKAGTCAIKRALELKSSDVLACLLQFAEPEMLTWGRVFEAVREGDDKLGLLLEAGADPNIASTRRSALHEAAALGMVDSIELLLAHGANINAKDFQSRTPLHTAIFEGNETAALILLENGAEPDTLDTLGHSGLMDACERGMAQAVHALVSAGADVNVVSAAGRPILHVAVSQGQQEIVELLLSAADLEVNVQDGVRHSALHEAAEIDHAGIADLLLKRGLDPGLEDENGELALHYSCGNGTGHVYRLLLEFGMKEYLDVTGSMFKMTPLQWAVMRGRRENARVLIEHGADVSINRSGKSALHYAAELGDGALVKLLVEAGASVTEKEGESGKTALQLAAESGSGEAVAALEEATSSEKREHLNEKP